MIRRSLRGLLVVSPGSSCAAFSEASSVGEPCRLRQCARAGSTALRSRRALSLKTVAINFSLAGPALHLADDNHLTADAVLLHPIRVITTQRGPHRHEGPGGRHFTCRG